MKFKFIVISIDKDSFYIYYNYNLIINIILISNRYLL